MSQSCSYCGLPVGRSRRQELAADEPVFCCYGCRFAAEVTRERGESGAAVWTLTKLGLAVFFTLNVLCFTMALWSDTVYGESPEALSASYASLLRYLGLVFSLPVLFLLGGPLLENAINDLRQGRLSTDLLLMTAVIAAFGYSAVSVVRGQGDVYFEVGCVILVTVTLGRWLEATSKLRATQALDELERLLPERVRYLGDDGRECSIPLAELAPPATVRVLAGERFPADGVLLSPAVSVDEQVLTGESWSATKQRGERILGGTLNLDGDVLLEVTASPSQTAIARLIVAVRDARRSQGPYQRLSDRVSRWFFPMIAAIAIFAFAFHWWRAGFDAGMMTALAVVLIACPCALGLATPMAVWTAIGLAAKRQVLFRNGEALERLAEVRELCLDKTGTLTTGEARVTRLALDASTSRRAAIAIAKALSASSNHSFSQAIQNWTDIAGPPEASTKDSLIETAFTPGLADADSRSLTLQGNAHALLDDIRVRSGLGIVAEVSDSEAALGNMRLMQDCGFAVAPEFQRQIDEVIRKGKPLTLLGWSGRIRAAFVFSETLRMSTRKLIDWCRDEHLPVTVITGDHPGRGARLEAELGIPVHAGMLPDEKAMFVKQRSGAAMIGDGINDAAALTAAHIGISLGAGTDVSRDAASVCLLNNDLSQLTFAIPLARRTVRTIRRNLAWAFGYNSLGVVVAGAGWLNPVIAALLMVVSSLVVVRSSVSLSERPA